MADIFEVDLMCRHSAHALVKEATEAAQEALDGAIHLVDGTLWPCWSWSREPKLWSGKHHATGHGSLALTTVTGQVIFVSDPVIGYHHDMIKLDDTVKTRWYTTTTGGVLVGKDSSAPSPSPALSANPPPGDLLGWKRMEHPGQLLP